MKSSGDDGLLWGRKADEGKSERVVQVANSSVSTAIVTMSDDW